MSIIRGHAAAMMDLRACAAEQGNRIFRMRLVLLLARECLMGDDFSPSVITALSAWIDEGKWGPVPWPSCPRANDWLLERGYTRDFDGYIRLLATAELFDASVQN